MLNDRHLVELEDKRTRRGYRVVSSGHDVFNPQQGLVVYIEDPQVHTYPWVSYVRVNEDGIPELDAEPATRLQLRRLRITSIRV